MAIFCIDILTKSARPVVIRNFPPQKNRILPGEGPRWGEGVFFKNVFIIKYNVLLCLELCKTFVWGECSRWLKTRCQLMDMIQGQQLFKSKSYYLSMVI